MLIQSVESCEGPRRTKDAIRNLVDKDDIITCGFGTGSLFKEKPLGTFEGEEVLRIYDKKMHEYVRCYFREHRKELTKAFLEEYSKTTRLSSLRLYNIVLKIIATSKEHL